MPIYEYRCRGCSKEFEKYVHGPSIKVACPTCDSGDVMRKLWQRHAPNLADAVIDSFTRSPLDVERCLPNMREGDLLVGAFANDQVGFHRPFAGAGAYRTHLPALYLCGSSSHPGGNITGLPAYNAAQVILADLGLAADWMPAPIAPRPAAM